MYNQQGERCNKRFATDAEIQFVSQSNYENVDPLL